MNAEGLVKKCLGQYVFLMGQKMTTIYQDTGADLPADIPPGPPEEQPPISIAFEPSDEGVILQHHAQIHQEPRSTPPIYPQLPTTENPTNYDSLYPQDAISGGSQGTSTAAYEQQPGINPGFSRQPYVDLGAPVQILSLKQI